jgi:hypothetical protein
MFEDLGWKPDGSFDFEFTVLSSADQVGADCKASRNHEGDCVLFEGGMNEGKDPGERIPSVQVLFTWSPYPRTLFKRLDVP